MASCRCRSDLEPWTLQHAAAEIDRMLCFRDRLRTHDDDRDHCAAVKRELSTREWRYVQDYAEAKTDVVKEILAKALT
ncbi:GrpB family protein [Actinophytocola sp.]|uniref:GrpB family protein n=1 Tax=Actinophytocola sp. TaxID=1872138 RepID=UPI002ED60A28